MTVERAEDGDPEEKKKCRQQVERAEEDGPWKRIRSLAADKDTKMSKTGLGDRVKMKTP